MPTKNNQLIFVIALLLILCAIIGGTIYFVQTNNAKISQIDKKAREVYEDLIENQKNINAATGFGIGVGEVMLTVKINSSSCALGNNYALFDVLANSKKVGEINVNNCESREGKVLAMTKDNIYFTILPGGLGGYILYGKYLNLYEYATANSKITKLLDLNNLTDFDFTTDRQKLVYTEFSSTTNNFSLVIKDLTDMTGVNYDLPDTYNQYGDWKFSPLGDQVAFAGGFGPANEKSAVFKLDITSPDNTPQIVISQTGKIYQVTGWKNNEEVIYK